MTGGEMLRWLRGAMGHALTWGAAWFVAAFLVYVVLAVTGLIPGGLVLGNGVMVGLRFGVVGTVAGGLFSGAIGLLYRGRRLTELSAARFGIGGGLLAGVFLTLMMTVPRLLTGEPMLPLAELVWTGLVAAGFGGIAAGGSLALAQRADRQLGSGDERPGRLRAQSD